MKLGWMRLALGTALVGATLSAQALTLNLTGYAGGGSGINLQGSAPSFNTNAGAFVGSLFGPDAPTVNPFYTYCVELTQTFGFGSPLPNYSLVPGLSYFTGGPAAAGTIVDRLGKLFTYLGGAKLPASANDSAAIQLAVWESIYEGTTFGNTDQDLANPGQFSSTTNSTIRADVAAAANTLLAAAALKTSLYSVSVLKNSNNQDFIVVTRDLGQSDVPEPASWALAGMALTALGVARRRRA